MTEKPTMAGKLTMPASHLERFFGLRHAEPTTGYLWVVLPDQGPLVAIPLLRNQDQTIEQTTPDGKPFSSARIMGLFQLNILGHVLWHFTRDIPGDVHVSISWFSGDLWISADLPDALIEVRVPACAVRYRKSRKGK